MSKTRPETSAFMVPRSAWRHGWCHSFSNASSGYVFCPNYMLAMGPAELLGLQRWDSRQPFEGTEPFNPSGHFGTVNHSQAMRAGAGTHLRPG